MTTLIEKVARAICFERVAPACRCTKETGCQANAQSLMDHTERPAQARAAIAAVAEWLCLEAARSASPAQAHEYLSATLLKKQLEQPK